MTDCGCNENNAGFISVQNLSNEIKAELQKATQLINGLNNLEDVTSIALITNNKVFVFQSEQVQPINFLISPSLTTTTTYEVKRDPIKKICCAYEVTHYSDLRPDTWRQICCEPNGQSRGSYYFSVNHRSDGKCCIYVQDIIPPAGGNGDPTLGPKREWKCEI